MTNPRTIVIGAAHWHVPLCVPAMLERNDIVGIHDDAPALVAEFAAAAGVTATDDWRSLADLPDVQLAYVFGEHDLMAERCLALIERGIPFVVEKPAGISLEQLVEVADAARAAGVAATVPLVQRNAPIETFLRQAGDAAYQRISFIAGPPTRYLANGSPWMVDPDRAGGGCLANLGPHFVDLFLRSVGTTDVTVRATTSSALHHGEIEDHATLVISTADGREGVIEVGYAFPGSPLKRYSSYTLAGAAGYADIATDGVARFTSIDGRTATRDLDVDSDPLYGPFVHLVADTLDSGFEGLPTLDELTSVMAVIWESYRQSRIEVAR